MPAPNILILVIFFSCVLLHCNAKQIIISTWANGFTKAVEKGLAELERGASSLDAVEVACRTCEQLQCDGTVGFGGSPDEHGETTLDALIMDGTRMDIGAVAGLRRIKNVIGVARRVLENTKHTLLVGDQATQFAKNMGFSEESLTTSESKEKWKAWRAARCQPNFWTNVKPNPALNCGPYKPIICKEVSDGYCQRDQSHARESNLYISQHNHDTIGVVAIDSKGNISAGTSTNGAIHKIPGRVGDSPIPGAGAYAVTGIGAGAATGDGDVMMRLLPSYLVVELLRSGIPLDTALKTAITRIVTHYPKFSGAVIGVDQEGNYAAACHGLEEDFPYSVGIVGEGVVVKTVACIKNILDS